MVDLPGEPPGNWTEGDYALVTELSGRKNKKKVIYFVVNLLEQVDDLYKCDWYELDRKKIAFKRLNAQWNVDEASLLRKIAPPILYGRRKNVMFVDVFRFLTGTIFTPQSSNT